MHYKHQSLSWALAAQGSDLAEALPELNALQQVVERSDWHNDDALQQSLRLFDWVKRLPASLLETTDAPEATLRALLTSIVDPEQGHYHTQELLAFAALIHDVGKAETFQRLPDGSTRCPGHEAVSARMAPAICARFDFTPAETRFVTHLAGAHGEPYALFKKIVSFSTPQQQEQIRRFEAQHARYLLPLLLLAWGDLLTSHLLAIRPGKYEAVFDFYRRWLSNIWSRGTQNAGERIDAR
jgi:hypothetical protein